jgi:hypothetical protein
MMLLLKQQRPILEIFATVDGWLVDSEYAVKIPYHEKNPMCSIYRQI